MAGARGLTNGEAPARGSAGIAPGPRATLTIGEAAARLALEFPGVTVAVLRRLETAGKFTPGRGPSGYRRYSEADLDLIRILLCDQAGAGPEPGLDPDLPGADADPVDQSAAGGARGRSPYTTALDPADLSGAQSPMTHPAVGTPDATRQHLPGGGQRPLAARTTARAARTATSRVPAARSAAAGRTQAPAIAALFDVAPGTAPGAHGPAQVPPPMPAAPAGSAALPGQIPAAPSAPATVPVPARAPSAAPGSPAPTTSTRRADRRWPDAEFFAPDLGEVALNRDQLAAAARTDRAWVDGLVEYGLLPSAHSAGGADLLVARASAELAQFGVEPRHLRAVAASAARVAELIATATSAGTGRDPARRERSLLAAPGRSAEAAAAAVRLHAALVRAALLRS
jgi:hypothetical protein